MEKQSRTAKSIINIKVALLFYVLNLALQFFSRKIFLDYLGSEVLGLNTTAQNLLQFLNLAELGIGSAIAYNLYKPIFDNDKQAISEIVSIQGWLYRRIAYVVIIASCILMCFFPLIFVKAEIPLWYSYGSFIAFLTSALLSYFVNYQQIVLSANQKEYKITIVVQSIKIIKVVLQIAAIIYFINGYLWWMILEMFMAFATSYVLNRTIRKEYPWLAPDIIKGRLLQKKYPTIIKKTKQVFFHKISTFVLTQTSPLIIYAYASLTMVAIYGNYMLIISGVTLLINALLNGLTASIGNLVAEGNKAKIKAVFWEITALRIWMSSVICFGLYVLANSFIQLWVGEQYILPHTPFIILILISFINLSRSNDAFLGAYGLYHDIWAPIMESVLNLGLSILLGYYYGLSGILSGVLISLLVIVCIWKPYFLFHYGFKESIKEYVLRYLKYLILLFLSFFISLYIVQKFSYSIVTDYLHWIIYSLIILVIYIVISLVLLCISDKSSRNFIRRIKKILIH